MGRIRLGRVMAVLVRVARRRMLLAVGLARIAAAAAAAAVRWLLMVMHLSNQSGTKLQISITQRIQPREK